jgi:uncharacterized protein YndB with AHSA1/START domain
MKIVKIILAVLILAIAGVAVLAARMPDEYLYSRDRVIAASPATLFAQANDLNNFNTWSPWANLDPNAKVTFDGAPAGPGASMHWDGNAKMGKGSMTIVESTPRKAVKYELVFVKPMSGTATSQLTFEPAGKGETKVTWTMGGHSRFFEKMINVVMNCEKMMGKQFDQGLINLAAKVERPAPKAK